MTNMFIMDVSDVTTELSFAADNLSVVLVVLEESKEAQEYYTNAILSSYLQIRNLINKLEEIVDTELARRRAEHGNQN